MNPSTDNIPQADSLRHPVMHWVFKGYGWLLLSLPAIQSVFLLIMRLHWGWEFFITGRGKLANIDKIVGFFHGLGIPFPTLNAYLAGCTECFGGLCLFLGLASRIVSVPLIFTMIVAYLTAERDALNSIFSDPDKFTSADPFLFMLTAAIVFLFGPGAISVDGLIGRIFKKSHTQMPTPPMKETT